MSSPGRLPAALWMRARTLVQLRLLRRTPIVIYQMGKVGSRSIYDSLRAQGIGPAIHVHRMNPAHIAAVAERNRRAGRPPPTGDVLGPLLYQQAVKRGRPLEVITLVRDPVARNWSAFFENLDRFAGPLSDRQRLDPSELRRLFLEVYPHEIPLTWFDDEFRAALGIDVYATPFPHRKGWLEIDAGPHRALILKLEAGDAVIEEAVGAFLGQPGFRLQRTNVGVEKPYARLYDEVTGSLRLSEEYLTRMYESRLATHFYSAAEIAAFRERWGGGSDSAPADDIAPRTAGEAGRNPETEGSPGS